MDCGLMATTKGDSTVMVSGDASVKVGAWVGVAVGGRVEVGVEVSMSMLMGAVGDVLVGVERSTPLDSRVMAIAVGQNWVGSGVVRSSDPTLLQLLSRLKIPRMSQHVIFR
jgi:hypothetical protein